MKLRRFTEDGHSKYILLYDKIKNSIIKNKGNIEKGFNKTKIRIRGFTRKYFSAQR